MLNEADKLPITRQNGNYFVLIPSRFPPVALYTRISSGRHEEVAEIAELYNPRLREKHRAIGATSDAQYARSPRLQNWNHAPFTYSNPEGSWFFDQFTKCLELSADKQTALAVSVAKRELFLSRTDEPPIGVDMRMVSRPVEGDFLDARGIQSNMSFENRRAFGRSILERRSKDSFDGVLFNGPERPTGSKLAILKGDVLGQAVQCEHFRYNWDGTKITNLYCFDSKGSDEDNSIDPDDLRGERLVLAA